MDYGIPTLIETNGIDECALLCKELGFNFIELNMNMPEYQIGNIDVDKFKHIAENNGIYYIIHLDENLNVCDFNIKVATAYMETVFQSIAICKKLCIPVLNMHLSSGVYFTMPDEKVYLFNKYMDSYLSSLEAFRNICDQMIGKHNIKICIENSDGYDKVFLQKGLSLLLESNNFALTFDIGHNEGIGRRDEKIIMQHPNKLYHMHIHDAKANKNHLPLGEGNIDVVKYLDIAKRCNCRIVIETKTVVGLKKSVEWLRVKEVKKENGRIRKNN